MKIVFLTACLEAGKDGVGDYTRFLAGECARRGVASLMVALNDRFASGVRMERACDALCLRMGAALPWPSRVAAARNQVEAFQPDWCSLQFVSYGFQNRGICAGLGRRLKTITGAVPVQVMFHELWVGAEDNAPWKHRLLGALQRRFVLEAAQRLRPRAVHTSNPAYAQLLAQNDIKAEVLPLFGAVPLEANGSHGWVRQRLASLAPARQGGSRAWLFGLFGTLHPVWPAEPLFSHLREAGRRHGREIQLAAIGRLGRGEPLWERLSREYADAFQFCALGEQSAERISDFLGTIDFGIATTPYALIGKSATAAAMLEHGVPVIVNRDDIQFAVPPANGSALSPLLIKMDDSLPDKLAGLRRTPPQSRLPAVTEEFLRALRAAAGRSEGVRERGRE